MTTHRADRASLTLSSVLTFPWPLKCPLTSNKSLLDNSVTVCFHFFPITRIRSPPPALRHSDGGWAGLLCEQVALLTNEREPFSHRFRGHNEKIPYKDGEKRDWSLFWCLKPFIASHKERGSVGQSNMTGKEKRETRERKLKQTQE